MRKRGEKGQLTQTEIWLLQVLGAEDANTDKKIDAICGDGKKAGCDRLMAQMKGWYRTYPSTGLSEIERAEKNSLESYLKKYGYWEGGSGLPVKVVSNKAPTTNPIVIANQLADNSYNSRKGTDPFGEQFVPYAPLLPVAAVAAGSASASNFVGAALGATANASAQYTDPKYDSKKGIDWSNVVVGGITSGVAVNYKLVGNLVINEAGYVAQNALNNDLGSMSWSGAAATGVGTVLGYAVGAAGSAIQWKLPSLTDKYLPSWGSSVTTTSNVPSWLTQFTAPFAQEYYTPKIQEKITDPIFGK